MTEESAPESAPHPAPKQTRSRKEKTLSEAMTAAALAIDITVIEKDGTYKAKAKSDGKEVIWDYISFENIAEHARAALFNEGVALFVSTYCEAGPQGGLGLGMDLLFVKETEQIKVHRWRPIDQVPGSVSQNFAGTSTKCLKQGLRDCLLIPGVDREDGEGDERKGAKSGDGHASAPPPPVAPAAPPSAPPPAAKPAKAAAQKKSAPPPAEKPPAAKPDPTKSAGESAPTSPTPSASPSNSDPGTVAPATQTATGASSPSSSSSSVPNTPASTAPSAPSTSPVPATAARDSNACKNGFHAYVRKEYSPHAGAVTIGNVCEECGHIEEKTADPTPAAGSAPPTPAEQAPPANPPPASPPTANSGPKKTAKDDPELMRKVTAILDRFKTAAEKRNISTKTRRVVTRLATRPELWIDGIKLERGRFTADDNDALRIGLGNFLTKHEELTTAGAPTEQAAKSASMVVWDEPRYAAAIAIVERAEAEK